MFISKNDTQICLSVSLIKSVLNFGYIFFQKPRGTLNSHIAHGNKDRHIKYPFTIARLNGNLIFFTCRMTVQSRQYNVRSVHCRDYYNESDHQPRLRKLRINQNKTERIALSEWGWDNHFYHRVITMSTPKVPSPKLHPRRKRIENATPANELRQYYCLYLVRRCKPFTIELPFIFVQHRSLPILRQLLRIVFYESLYITHDESILACSIRHNLSLYPKFILHIQQVVMLYQLTVCQCSLVKAYLFRWT